MIVLKIRMIIHKPTVMAKKCKTASLVVLRFVATTVRIESVARLM